MDSSISIPENIICPDCKHDGKPDGRSNFWHTMYFVEGGLLVGCNKCRKTFVIPNKQIEKEK